MSKLKIFFQHSWWVFAFIIGCMILFEHGLKHREALFKQLTGQKKSLEKEKEEASIQQANLQLQLNSQSDLAWQELTLMKGMGLVPEGQQKVYFYTE